MSKFKTSLFVISVFCFTSYVYSQELYQNQTQTYPIPSISQPQITTPNPQFYPIQPQIPYELYKNGFRESFIHEVRPLEKNEVHIRNDGFYYYPNTGCYQREASPYYQQQLQQPQQQIPCYPQIYIPQYVPSVPYYYAPQYHYRSGWFNW